MFSESCLPLPWDKEKNYNRESIELYYEVSAFMSFLFQWLLLPFQHFNNFFVFQLFCNIEQIP